MKGKHLILLLLLAALLSGGAAIAYPKTRSTQDKPIVLYFVENNGQITDQNLVPRYDIQFRIAATGGLNIFVGQGAIHYQFTNPEMPLGELSSEAQDHNQKTAGRSDGEHIIVSTAYSLSRLDVELIGANKEAKAVADAKDETLPAAVDLEKKENTATGFSRVTYKNIYPHIDWILYTVNGQLKHEFVIKKGGKVTDIKVKYTGTNNLKINKEGNLIAETAYGAITEKAPVTYQKDGTHINSIYRLSGDMLSYETGNYFGDLVIDPLISW